MFKVTVKNRYRQSLTEDFVANIDWAKILGREIVNLSGLNRDELVIVLGEIVEECWPGADNFNQSRQVWNTVQRALKQNQTRIHFRTPDGWFVTAKEERSV